MFPLLPKSLGYMASPFPLWREKKAVALATKAAFIHDLVTAMFALNEGLAAEVIFSCRMNVSVDDGVGVLCMVG